MIFLIAFLAFIIVLGLAAILGDEREEKDAKAKGCLCTWGALLRRNHVGCELHGQGLRDFHARYNR